MRRENENLKHIFSFFMAFTMILSSGFTSFAKQVVDYICDLIDKEKI